VIYQIVIHQPKKNEKGTWQKKNCSDSNKGRRKQTTVTNLAHPQVDADKSLVACDVQKLSPLSKKKKKVPSRATKEGSVLENVIREMSSLAKPSTIKFVGSSLQCTETQIEYIMLSLIDKAIAIEKDFTSSKGRIKTLYWANLESKSKKSPQHRHCKGGWSYFYR